MGYNIPADHHGPTPADVKRAEGKYSKTSHYEPVSKTDSSCLHCRTGFYDHYNGRCPNDGSL